MAHHTGPVNTNVKLLYGFSFFNPFMIVVPVWVPYLATQGITMRQFMELHAVFAIVISRPAATSPGERPSSTT